MAAARSGPADRPPRLLFLVTDDWYFVSHRLQLAVAAREAGYDVHVATRVEMAGDRIRAAGLTLHPLSWRRGASSPLAKLAALREIVRLYRNVRPDLVHHVALRPIVYGQIAARFARVGPSVDAIAGLGFVFTERSWRSTLLRPALVLALRVLLARPGSVTLLQNPDDRDLLLRSGALKPERARLVLGAGVDTEHFQPLPEPASGPVTVAVATRMVRYKGVADLVEASRILHRRGVAHRLVLAGIPDATNPAAIPEETLRKWASEPQVEWLGKVEDVREVWAQAHVAALCSHGGEGVPKALLEAAACGRPLLATDVPGSREVARGDETGLRVPPRDPQAIADALERLILDAGLRARLGSAARKLVETELSSGVVIASVLALYREILPGA